MHIGPATKGLRVKSPTTPQHITAQQPHITDDIFSWPLLTLSDSALTHNVTTMAQACAEYGVAHAPHVKTAMSPALFARQRAVGAWGASVANPGQLRTVHTWGVKRIFLANELVDIRDMTWLREALTASDDLRVLIYIDSPTGVALLAQAFAGADDAVVSRLGLLVEVGTASGRTGTRTLAEVTDVARAAHTAGLCVAGIAGYEGSVARGSGPEALEAVQEFCAGLRSAAQHLLDEGLLADGEVVISAGGSAYVDVVLPALPGPLTNSDCSPRPVLALLRSGAYITADHGLLKRADPWARMDPPRQLQPAATVWAQVLSTPEPGLALCGAGRRDLPYDIDLPVAMSIRKAAIDGAIGAAQPLHGVAVTKLDDQHAYLSAADDGVSVDDDASMNNAVPAAAGALGLDDISPGDVIGFGISHPCTLFDKWATALVIDKDERVIDLIHTEF